MSRSMKQRWSTRRNWLIMQLCGMQTVINSQRNTGNNLLSGAEISNLLDELQRAELRVRNSLFIERKNGGQR